MTAETAVTPRRWHSIIVLFRIAWTALFVFGLNFITPLGTSPWIVSVFGAIGVIIASSVARTQLNWRGFLLIAIGTWIAQYILLNVFDSALNLLLPPTFSFDKWRMHFETCLMAFALTSVATWFFWRSRVAITCEALLLSFVCILLFAGHRDFHLDRPRVLNSLAWRLGFDHITMLLAIGTALLIGSLVYLYVASHAKRPHVDRTKKALHSTGRNIPLSAFVLIIVGGAIYLVLKTLYGHYNAIMLTRVANGVGMSSESGVSPLSFQSALGSTNQPAALVRLDGDYPANPFSPMMYLRESALSSFNGHEMVAAGRAFDTDLPGISPKEAFTGKEDAELNERTPVTQSVYLLADHENIFALDYPLSIVQLKNPKPNRFKAAYRAYSIGPGFKLSELVDKPVGDPRWTADVLAHYLEKHTDPRYQQLADQIAAGIDHPIEKMNAITAYLSRTAIYTLTPHHDVEPNQDPVAPFLFGDHRGYCVHFAHAMVYLARALGIPSRIGTGYLTDLSQSKDGHILLRMSDRHAWAEVFVTGIGWVPFDVQPDQVESHAETQVDAKLLEELMGILEPGEEILPSESVKDEPGMLDESQTWTPDPQIMLWTVLLAAVLLIAVKAFLLSGWRVFRDPQRRLKWAYISLAAELNDLGIIREHGETRSEFAVRSPGKMLSTISHLITTARYAPDGQKRIEGHDLKQTVREAKTTLRSLPRWKRILSVVNPSSVLRFIGRQGW